MSISRVLSVLFFVSPSAVIGNAQTPARIHVDAGLFTGANDGSSWANAFRGPFGLQTALAAVPPATSAEIWVANGTYRPGPASSGNAAHFALRDGVAIFGGFAGGETSAVQANPGLHIAILSGDLASNDVFAPVMGIPQWQNASENSHHVVVGAGVGSSAVLDGFVIRRGAATGSFIDPFGHGAGIELEDASPTIRRCTIRECNATSGAGLHATGGAAQVLDCVFEINHSQSVGAGAWVEGAVDAHFQGCTFRANTGGRGVGLYIGSFFSSVPQGSRAELVDCRFESNTGPIGAPAGMGVYVNFAELSATSTSFVDNRSGGGGGGVFVDDSQAEFRGCDFVGNSGAFDGGGAAYVNADDTGASLARFIDTRFVGNNGVAACVHGATLELTNCTMVANDMSFGSFVTWPVVFAVVDASVHLRNCIVRDHAPSGPAGLAGNFSTNVNSVIRIDDSCVESWDGSLPGLGNFDLDPLFADPLGADDLRGTSDDDLALLPASPCVDRSLHDWRTLAWGTDQSGAQRFVDRTEVADIGPGCPPRADLGALERKPDGPWTDLGGGSVSGPCLPHLVGSGTLLPGAPTELRLVSATPLSAGYLVIALSPTEIPVRGTVIGSGPQRVKPWRTSALGTASFTFPWPAHLQPGTNIVAQAWHRLTPTQWEVSNARLGTTP